MRGSNTQMRRVNNVIVCERCVPLVCGADTVLFVVFVLVEASPRKARYLCPEDFGRRSDHSLSTLVGL